MILRSVLLQFFIVKCFSKSLLARNCIFKPFKYCNEVYLHTRLYLLKYFIQLMGGLGRFTWKQTNIRGVHSLNENTLMDRGRVQCANRGVSGKAEMQVWSTF